MENNAKVSDKVREEYGKTIKTIRTSFRDLRLVSDEVVDKDKLNAMVYTFLIKERKYSRSKAIAYMEKRNFAELTYNGEKYSNVYELLEKNLPKKSTRLRSFLYAKETVLPTFKDWLFVDIELNRQFGISLFEDKELIKDIEGISDVNTVLYYIMDGFNVTEAINLANNETKDSFRHYRFSTDIGVYYKKKLYKSISELATELQMVRKTFVNRLNVGYSVEVSADNEKFEELSEFHRKNIAHQNRKATYKFEGQEYDNFDDIANKLGVPTSLLKTHYYKNYKGKDMDFVGKEIRKKYGNKSYFCPKMGKHYISIAEFCNDHNITQNMFHKFRKRNKLTTREVQVRVSKYGIEGLYQYKYDGKRFRTKLEICEYVGLTKGQSDYLRKLYNVDFMTSLELYKTEQKKLALGIPLEVLRKKYYDNSYKYQSEYFEGIEFNTFKELCEKVNVDYDYTLNRKYYLKTKGQYFDDMVTEKFVFYIYNNAYYKDYNSNDTTVVFRGKLYESLKLVCEENGFNYRKISKDRKSKKVLLNSFNKEFGMEWDNN